MLLEISAKSLKTICEGVPSLQSYIEQTCPQWVSSEEFFRVKVY